ncbi:MAG TPA: alpha-ketoglutarate-dependent dioxygenase AlkB [Urbifossiella sp.]|jgi:alkylated DNA repair dioxygenase AlkB|nr:alpha-ketoglutarate-dependent dioxygenase AlkB [Urbifossiella sp.]
MTDTTVLPGFTPHALGGGLTFLTGALQPALVWDAAAFEAAWDLHPADKHIIHMPGGPVETPRWQQAYGADHRYTGRVNRGRPVPALLEPLRDWARAAINPQLNALLLNWYEGPGHYIGPHHDDDRDMIAGTPIATLSFGETRVFRLTRATDGGKETRDFPAENGAVFVLPFATNRVWKHAVPKSARYTGRRISVTVRAFTALDGG